MQKLPRIMHPKHMDADHFKQFKNLLIESYEEAFDSIRENYHMSKNQAHAFLRDFRAMLNKR